MAKQRKPKTEEPKLENSGAVVRHQKLCLSIDFPNRQIYGYTELEIVVPDIGIVGLHAENLGVESVLVDGEPAEFEYYPHHQLQHQLAVENENRWRTTVTCSSTAADAAGAAYVSALERELVPNLLINCCKAFQVSSDTLAPGLVDLDDGAQSSEDAKQIQKLVRINYCVERTDCGLHFDGNVLHTNDQIRRARCWFPCIDGDSQRWCFDLEFTVAQNLVAVSSGTLLYQVLSKDDPPRKTFVYRLDVPALPRWISLVVAPFQILPDPRIGIMSHMCLAANLTKLKNTVGFFHNAFNFYEEYLGLPFPLGSYTQAFIAPETMITPLSFGASMSVFSSQLLYDDNIIDKAIDTSVSLALALARQWFGIFITPEESTDEWLVDGLASFLTDLFIKKFLGNNEVRYRRFKANCSVCKADDSGASVLSSAVSCKDLYGTHCIGLYGKLRTRKSVAVLQMLEKQMGPESFRKILQRVVSRAREIDPVRSISTKEFRHFATKVGNLERPFVKEFFPRWVCSCGCPMFRMGFSYNKRKNLIELAVLRECTLIADSSSNNLNTDSENRDADQGWPGMMSIRVHELDGMYDHPVLPLAGDSWQLLEISCHSKLATKRFIKPKKGAKPDGSDDNELTLPTDLRSNLESPLLWLRADPEMEYLADIHFIQPVQMWINQLEKDGDVVAQAQAISALEELPQLSFAVINSLTNFMSDSKGFWRVRVQAAFVLARTSSEDTDWAGLLNLIKFYKSRRFDATIGLPKPNDFSDFPEYFVLEAIPHAVSMVRTVDGKSPREAIEFILQLLKYNDNTGNRFSDVFWLSTLVEAAGQLDFGRQSHVFVSPLLKRIDRLIQYDRLMPSYNGILTTSCIRSLTQLAVKFSTNAKLLMDNAIRLIRQFRDYSSILQVKVEANRGLVDLECHSKGLDAALTLFMTFLKEESSLRGQVKLAIHMMRLCQTIRVSDSDAVIHCDTLVALLCLLETDVAFNNVLLRHYLFCIVQVIAGRPATLFGVRRDKTFHLNGVDSDPKNIFTALEPSLFMPHAEVDTPVAEEGKIDTISAIDQSEVPLVGPEATKEEQKTAILKIKVKRVEEERSHCSSVSVDAPGRHEGEGVSVSNQREEANSCVGSRTPGDGKTVEGTADSVKKRKRDDPQYLERKRLKKERKQKKREMSKLIIDSAPAPHPLPLPNPNPPLPTPNAPLPNPNPPLPTPTAPRFRIKIKNNLPSQP